MVSQAKWRTHLQEHKTLFIMIAVGLFLVELEIFAMAAMKSGRESRLQIHDHQDNIIYEVKSNKLDSQEKASFEKTFGPLSNYRVNLISVDRPFPFRAWFAAAVGLPVGAVLLFGFFIKAYEALFIRNEPASNEQNQPISEPTDRLDRVVARVSRLNIFAIGAFVLLFALGLWAIPSMLAEFGRHGVATLSRYKWVALGVVLVFLGLVVWIIYLRYRLAHKTIESQADVEKFRLQLEMSGSNKTVHRLAAPVQEHPEPPKQIGSKQVDADSEEPPSSKGSSDRNASTQ